jgi:hypothetical protein
MRPAEFDVNHTWLAFRANRAPIVAGDAVADVFVLQDAASMFIFGAAFASPEHDSPSEQDVAALLQQAWDRRHEWPQELVVSGKPSKSNSFVRVAERIGVPVRAVPEPLMSFYIKDVQSSMEEFLSGQRSDDASGSS